MINAVKKFTCPVCNKVEILQMSGKKVVKNINYTEAVLAIDKDKVCRFGLCKGCVNELTEIKCRNVFKRFQKTWNDDLISSGKAHLVKSIDAMEYKTFGKNKGEALQKMIELEKAKK